MKRLVIRLLTRASAFHPKNKGKAYPQLWHCMPSRYVIPKTRCFVCAQVLTGSNTPQDGQPGHVLCASCAARCSLEDWNRIQARILSQTPKLEARRKHWIGYWLKPMLQWLCGKLAGHEPSNTEWGYGGGKFVDRNCRWCDKILKVPIQEDPPPNQILADFTELL